MSNDGGAMDADEAGLRDRALAGAPDAELRQAAEHQRLVAVRAEQDLAEARRALAETTALLDALQRSSSWRITRPLRVLTRLARGDQSPGQVLRSLAPGLAGLIDRVTASWRRQRLNRDQRQQARPEPRAVNFPLAGALTTLSDLTGTPPPLLDLTVSVIIPTLNPGSELPWLLRKLRAQKALKGVEIVLVDSGSTDGAVDLARTMGCKVVSIAPADFSHSHARNLGADNARGDLLLFTVQDAYPIGDYWLRTLAEALVGAEGAGSGLAAVSCVEFPRTDSELMYNAAIDVHSRFLGCADRDRVGQFTGEGHEALRTQGQISDLACLISAETFRRYRYEGRYAEDLILGVRLIRDGLKVAMLSSVKVVHSHNRSAAYHLKRNFVDTVFLSEAFGDLPIPNIRTARSAVIAGEGLMTLVTQWRQERLEDGGGVRKLAAAARRGGRTDPAGHEVPDYGVPGLGAWLRAEAAAPAGDAAADAQVLRHSFADRLEGLAEFIDRTYSAIDDVLAHEILSAVDKTLAASLGAHLAFYYLNSAAAASPRLSAARDGLRALMLSGV